VRVISLSILLTLLYREATQHISDLNHIKIFWENIFIGNIQFFNICLYSVVAKHNISRCFHLTQEEEKVLNICLSTLGGGISKMSVAAMNCKKRFIEGWSSKSNLFY
jgi:hypothetical protein